MYRYVICDDWKHIHTNICINIYIYISCQDLQDYHYRCSLFDTCEIMLIVGTKNKIFCQTSSVDFLFCFKHLELNNGNWCNVSGKYIRFFSYFRIRTQLFVIVTSICTYIYYAGIINHIFCVIAKTNKWLQCK